MHTGLVLQIHLQLCTRSCRRQCRMPQQREKRSVRTSEKIAEWRWTWEHRCPTVALSSRRGWGTVDPGEEDSNCSKLPLPISGTPAVCPKVTGKDDRWNTCQQFNAIVNFQEVAMNEESDTYHIYAYASTFTRLNFCGYRRSTAIYKSFIPQKFRPVWQWVCVYKMTVSKHAKKNGDDLLGQLDMQLRTSTEAIDDNNTTGIRRKRRMDESKTKTLHSWK